MANQTNFDLNNFDQSAISIINNFWEQPQYTVPDINEQSYYTQRYAPYNTNQRSYDQSYTTDPFDYYYVQNPYYQMPMQPAGPTIYTDVPQLSPSSESIYSVNSYSSNTSTITLVETPPSEVYTIEIPDNVESLLPVDEQVLKECLEIIDITNTPDTTPTINVAETPVPDISEYASRKYSCTACNKLFINRPGLRKHFKTKVHKKEVADKGIPDPVNDPTSWAIGEHKCFVCGKQYAKYTDMIDHVVKH